MLARRLGERMADRGGGHMVFISSLAGKSGQARSSIYSATKFGLRGFVQGLRGDLETRNIGVSAGFPGLTRDAGMVAEAGTKLPAGVGISAPEEVAQAGVRAIDRNLFEVDVAPFSMRAMTTF